MPRHAGRSVVVPQEIGQRDKQLAGARHIADSDAHFSADFALPDAHMAWRKWLRGSLQPPVVFWGAAQQHVPTRVEEVGPLEGPEHSMLCVVEGEDILVGLARSYVLEDLATEPSVVVRLARKELAPIM